MPVLSRPARSLPRLARYTLHHHGPAAVLDGAVFGIISLAPFIVKRSLGASEAMVPLLIVIGQTAWIFAPAVAPYLARLDPQRAWKRIALLAHLPLLLVAFVFVEVTGSGGRGHGTLWLFIVALSLHYSAGIASLTHRGALLRANYAPDVRGRAWGGLQVVTILSSIFFAKSGGLFLDHDPRLLRVLYPLAALWGIAGFRRLSRIRWQRQRRTLLSAAAGEPGLRAVARAWRHGIAILKSDRSFRTFEIGFMLYGFAFLMSWPLLVLFAEQRLGLSYDQWTWAQAFSFPLAQIGGMFLLGRVMDRIGVERTTMVSFAMLFLFLLLVPHVGGPYQLSLCYLLFGGAMAGVNLAWSLGPLHFAPEGRAHAYTAAHLSCVGVRSLLAPFLGVLIKSWFSYEVAFGVAACLMALGTLTMYRLSQQRLSSAVSPLR